MIYDASFVKAPGGVDICYRVWGADQRGPVVLVVHGVGAHADYYAPVCCELAARGAVAVALDLRGHGRSGGPRGHVARLADHLADISAVWDDVAPGRPAFLFGESYGGLVCFHHAVYSQRTGGHRVAGLLLSAPAFGVAGLTPRLVGFAVGAARFVPRASVGTGIDMARVSHRPHATQFVRRDPLWRRRLTLGFLRTMFSAQRAAPGLAPELSTPSLWLIAGDDQIVSNESARAVFSRLGSADRTWKEYPGAYHGLSLERTGEMIQDVWPWIMTHTGPES